MEFKFESVKAAPYIGAPASPKRFGSDAFDFYDDITSEPTSPSAVAAFRDIAGGYSSARLSSVPFDWEEKPGMPKYTAVTAVAAGGSDDDNFDCLFPVSKQVEKGLPSPPTPLLTAADELFEEGKIRPLKTPPSLYKPEMGKQSSKSPRKLGLWSPRLHAGKDVNPFAAAMSEVTRDRGRSRSRKVSRSLSPFRFGRGRGEEGDVISPLPCATIPPSAAGRERGSAGSRRRWRLKDFLHFRSLWEAGDRKNSISSASSSSSLQSMKAMKNRGSSEEDSVTSSFRSVESESMRRGPSSSSSSPKEAEFRAERAVEEKKKKKMAAPPPFRQSLSSYLSFNPVRSLTGGAFGGFSLKRR